MISQIPPEAAIKAIRSGIAQIARNVEIYDITGDTQIADFRNNVYATDGSVTLDYSRDERRMLDISLYNYKDLLTPRVGGFWYDSIIKAYRGVRYPIKPVAPHFETHETWVAQIGEFMIDRIEDEDNSSLVKIVGRDYTKKCIKSKFEQSVSFPSGTYIYEIIRALAANSGITKMKLPLVTESLGASFDVERGTTRWSVMKDIASSHNYELFFDATGYLVMRPFVDPTLDAPVMHFKTGQEGNLVSRKRSIHDTELYNHIVVTGEREGVEGSDILLPYFGEAKNEDPNSPTSIKRIGDRPYFYTSNHFTSDAQCQALALSYLRIYSLESYDLEWESLVYPHVEVGSVVQVEERDSISRLPSKYLLDTATIPFTLDPMNATGKRVLIAN